MTSILGIDGKGYELARKLESQGIWRIWLGEELYSSFIHSLSSSSSWQDFMKADDDYSKTKSQLHLQLRARALLFDKAALSLFIPSNSTLLHNNLLNKLTPNYLQLHGDDIYFTLENPTGGGSSNSNATSTSFSKSKSTFGGGSRYTESEIEAMSQRFKLDELPETWYTQFFEKYKSSKSYRVSFGDQETEKRTPEQMSIYLRVLENHKRRRVAFIDEQHMGFGSSVSENGSNNRANYGGESNSADDESPFFPETMFSMNSIPENAVLQTAHISDYPKVKFNGVLDTLPQVTPKSPVINPIMIERLGIKPDYLSTEQSCNGMNGSGGSKKLLSEKQASKMSQKVIARVLSNVGFEASSEVPLEVLTQLFSCHASKLGCVLKHLADSYKKQCSANELIKMFLHTAGHSNLAGLTELVKDNSRSSGQQVQQHVQGIQSPLQLQQQASIRQSQQQNLQIARQMNPQMQQMHNNQNIYFQQQQQFERMRRRQQPTSTSRPAMGMNSNMHTSMSANSLMNMNMDQQRPMVQVKIENQSDFPVDNNSFNATSARQAQVQLRQQQFAAMSSLQAQSGNQFRPVGSPQMHSPNTGMARAPPVKVEGFQELMGGDAILKHDSEENKLTSPSK
ncbi:hypothetical protein Leryth_023246 [Lithospermum erythrorhizon]|nr:hypothetical protein Leryth_023246 [Lithospermum erythrorhizon]